MSKINECNSKNYDVKPFDFIDYNYKFSKPSEESQDHISEAADEVLRKAKDDALQILSDAKQQSQLLIEEAKQQRDTAFELGYQEGYEVGSQQGYTKAVEEKEQEYDAKIRVFQEEVAVFVEQMHEKKQQVLNDYIEDLKKICLAVAEKIIRTSLKSSGEIIKRMIISATSKLKKTQWAKIYVGSSQQSRLVEGDANLLKELSHVSNNIKIIVMDDEEEGNCILEFPDEIMDLSITTQLQNVKDILNNASL